MDTPHHHHDDYNPPRTVEAIFMDYKARRAGIIRALTTDVNKFYNQCDPEKDILGLYGLPNRRWEVVQPTEDVPPAVPEPILGINFAKDSMPKNDWISLVAIHSDSWLMSVAYFYLGRFGFDRADRTRFFNRINELPTVFEVVNGVESYKKPANGRGGISKSDSKIKSEGRQLKPPKDEDEIPNGQDEDGGNEDASCGTWKTGKDDF